MEKGVIRFEPNISIRPVGATEFGTRTELKNLNSFRALERGTAYELMRQAKVLNEGGKVVQETRGWDEQRNVTVPQRSKEQAEDYRYFPEPDLPPLIVERAWVEEIRAQLPELPDAKYDRFVKEYGLSADDASVLVADRAVADYFEATLKQSGGKNPKAVCNWLTGELFRYLNESQMPIEQVKITPAQTGRIDRAGRSGHDQPQHGQARAWRRCSSPASRPKRSWKRRAWRRSATRARSKPS